MTTITDIHGNQHQADCIACAIQCQEIEAPLGTLAENASFRLEQDIELPIPGFLVLISKRHIFAVDEFSESEQADFMELLVGTRRAMRKVAQVETAYLVLEEDTESSHFHMWLMPFYPWMQEKFGRGVGKVKQIMDFAKQEMKTSENLEDVRRVAALMEAELIRPVT